jgi:XTP/dITP diphosphohydrolase
MAVFVCATRNRHKVSELQALIGGGHEFLTLDRFPAAPPVVEDLDSFEGNAGKKALTIARWLATQPDAVRNGTRCWVLADDSGLEVDALSGAPGVHSARFAALDTGAPGNSPDADNNAKLLRLMANVPAPRRSARFRCVIALVELLPGGEVSVPELFSGACEGVIDLEPRGHAGFGYDPLFVPHGFSQSFAELREEEKNRISHRANAVGKLRTWLHGR